MKTPQPTPAQQIGGGCLSLILIAWIGSVAFSLITGGSSKQTSQDVAELSFPGEWPLVVPAGKLSCETPSAIVFTDLSGKKYAVNGTAEAKGYADIRPIWKDDPKVPGTKISIAPAYQRRHKAL